MKSFLAASSLAICLCAALPAQTPKVPAESSPGHLVLEKPLSPGGTLVLTLNVGDLRIQPVSGNKAVRLEIETERPADPQTLASWVTRFEVAAERATLDIRTPKSSDHCADCYGGSTVVVYVPQQTELKVQLGVGDLTISGIQGNKELHVDIGDLKLAVAGPDEYDHVETHTRIGDISDSLSQGAHGHFLGQSEDFSLNGRFHLKASVGIGDVNIHRESGS